MTEINELMKQLRAEFPESELAWRVGQMDEGRKLGQALPFIDARQVQDRLDSVLGPDNWQTAYTEVVAGNRLLAVRCRLSVRLGGDWVSKEDAAPLGSGDLAVKGVYSDALKRAAVHWGIGRYLYAFVAPWVELDAHGKLTRVPALSEGMGVAERTEATIAAAKSPEAKPEAKPAEKPAEKTSETKTAEAQPPVTPEPSSSAAEQRKPQGQGNSEAPAAKPEPSKPATTSVLTPPAEHAVDADDVVDGHANRQAAAAAAPAQSAQTASAAPAGGKTVTEADIKNPSPLYSEMLVKLQKLPPKMVKSYIEGPKGQEKLSADERAVLLQKVAEREKQMAAAT